MYLTSTHDQGVYVANSKTDNAYLSRQPRHGLLQHD